MQFEVNGSKVFASIGGHEHVQGQPWVLFLHGAGNCHLTWTQQVRAFAYNGYNVLAPDMPGHDLSEGEPIQGIEAQAKWLVGVMDVLGIDKAHLVGHSQGGIIALEASVLAPSRITSITFVATAAAIPANPALIKMAEENPEKAFNLMVSWGSGTSAHAHANSVPGVSLIDAGLRVMGLNAPNALATDLSSCADYENGVAAAKNLTCPSLCIFAKEDKMTPVRAGRVLAENLPKNELHILEGAGHTLPLEKPQEVNQLIKNFYQSNFK
ncbi:MAG: alpha/beta hydrolase [Hyphomicrobiales bacterium]|nr:MAG: alpha/beta hydrolase [Hyphomicrobiales bacterium]